MKRRRDTDRSVVYSAEGAADRVRDRHWLNREGVERLAGVVGREYGLPIRVILSDSKWRVTARGGKLNGRARINVPRWGMFEQLILHELAHCLIPDDAAWHGPEWRAVYLRLVRRYGTGLLYRRVRTEFEVRGLL